MRLTRPVTTIAGAAALTGSILFAAAPARAATTQTATCTDGGGHLWSLHTTWGAVTSGKVASTATGFTSSAADATTADWSMRIYNRDGSQAQVTGGQDTAVTPGKYTGRNLTDPTSGGARITVSVGDGNDGYGNCAVTFTEPGTTSSPSPSPSPSPTPTGTACKIAATGDVAGTDYANAKRTAAVVSATAPRKLLLLGDLAYTNGTLSEFNNYYDPAYGSLKPISAPVPGNHEYNTSGAPGYKAYFDTTAANYAYDLCGWRIVAINEYLGIDLGARFIASERAAHPGVPMLTYWHQPRFSSGSEHGNDSSVQALWAAAVKAGAKIVLNGHDHDYERFSPQSSTGSASAIGPREFVAGLGGHSPRGWGTIRANSQKRISASGNLSNLGVLVLDLQAKSYSWQFKQVSGSVGDSGTTSF